MRFGVFIYEGVEPMDLATFGVLSMARRIVPEIEILTIAPVAGQVTLSNGLVVTAPFGMDNAPRLDALIITGGPGWKAQAAHGPTLDYVRQCVDSHLVVSVCTGAMILAASGALEGRRATTKQEVIAGQEASPIDVLREAHPGVRVVEARLADDGQIITGGGVSLCIDTTLHLLKRVFGEEVAQETARIIEYTSALEANETRLPSIV